jgi:threonine/homoserine/homoserine lactone efflux protein
MRELPKPLLTALLVIGAALILFVGWNILNSENANEQQQYLDQLDIKTGNPQPAGENTAP